MSKRSMLIMLGILLLALSAGCNDKGADTASDGDAAVKPGAAVTANRGAPGTISYDYYIFVSDDYGTDDSGCGAKDDPCATIQYGKNVAYTAGKDVIVAGGTYNESVYLKTSLYCGYTYDHNTHQWSYDDSANPVVTEIVGVSGYTYGIQVNGAYSNIHIDSCTIKGPQTATGNTQGFQSGGAGVKITNSKIYSGNAADTAIGILGNGGDLTAINNFVFSKPGSSGDRADGILNVSGCDLTAINNTIVAENNASSNYTFGFYTWTGAGDSILVNNIIVADIAATSSYQVGVRVAPDTSVTLINNLIVSPVNTKFFGWDGIGGTYSADTASAVNSCPTPYCDASNGNLVDTSAGFTDQANGDYTLGSSSLAINAGLGFPMNSVYSVSPSLTIDIAGNARPYKDSRWDIGAYVKVKNGWDDDYDQSFVSNLCGAGDPYCDDDTYYHYHPTGADFDQDGYVDILSEGYVFYNVYSTASKIEFDAGVYVGTDTSLFNYPALGDLDGDGDIDIASFNANGVQVILNPGTRLGSWTVVNDPCDEEDPPNEYSYCSLGNGQYPDEIEIGDMDRDGDLDIVVIDQYYGHIFIFNNDGSANFSLAPDGASYYYIDCTTLSLGDGSIELGDLNNDSYLDIVCTDFARVKVYLADAANISSGVESYIFDDSFYKDGEDVALIDVDNDADLDIVLADSSVYFSYSIALNDGDANFPTVGSWVNYDDSADSSFLLYGDFSGGGYLDLLTPQISEGGDLYICSNDFDGTYCSTSTLLNGSFKPGTKQFIADFDNNGYLDIAGAFLNNGNLGVLQGD